ncbi:hypothetical protein F0U62_44720 [Cystobacter fuscus]|uniref:hypothetical protein n=1 Tax=Cystobacter fuscus TaxID=43 RepID=UPI002B2F2F36|nr:hypothetical protein F0U62_44720 [Cystobacter fuscus]
MEDNGSYPAWFRDGPHGVFLLLLVLLGGCVTVPGGREFQTWNPEVSPLGAPLRTTPMLRPMLSASDGPVTTDAPSNPSIRGYDVPGRKPDSQMPWELFLGNAAHRMVSYMYGVAHPGSEVHYNTKSLSEILARSRLGNPSRLRTEERELRPDITDVTALYLFEIKPRNEQGLQEGRREVQLYLTALNRAMEPPTSFSRGTEFQGEILIRFARGQHIWRLEWQTSEPGVVQYRWNRSQQRFDSEVSAYEANQWAELSEQDIRQYGGWVGQAVEGMVVRRERLATFSGVVGIFIDIIGNAATGFFSAAIFSHMDTGPGTQQPPTAGGAQVIPFPARPPPIVPPAQAPAAAGMSIPR